MESLQEMYVHFPLVARLCEQGCSQTCSRFRPMDILIQVMP